MNSYEVTLIEKKEKTLLVNAESEVDAMLRVQNGFVRGEIDIDDTSDRLVKFIVDDARAGLFAIKTCSDNEFVDISEVTKGDDLHNLGDKHDCAANGLDYDPCRFCHDKEICAACED